MKKTINVNLNGSVFIIDEDAYSLLNNYLETLKNAFSSSNYDEDLIDDVEGRIAELLFVETNNGQQIVSLKMVEHIIKRIGSPEEIIGIAVNEETGNATVEEEIEPPIFTPNQKTRHRLYRDPRGKEIGGVCSGIASYLGIDVTVVRLIAIALLIVSASTITLIYFILWIAMPEAKTPLQIMELEGESPTLSNIGKTVTDTFKGAQQKVVENRSAIRGFFDGLVKVAGVCAKIILVIAGVVAIPVLIALIGGFIGCIVGLIGALCGIGTALFDTLPIELATLPGGIYLILGTAISAIIMIAIPLMYIILWIIGSFTNKTYTGKTANLTFAIIWVISILTTIVLALLIFSWALPLQQIL